MRTIPKNQLLDEIHDRIVTEMNKDSPDLSELTNDIFGIFSDFVVSHGVCSVVADAMRDWAVDKLSSPCYDDGEFKDKTIQLLVTGAYLDGVKEAVNGYKFNANLSLTLDRLEIQSKGENNE